MTADNSRLRAWCENPATGIQSACSVGMCKKRKGPLKTSAGGYSDIGTVRKTNDDLVFASNQCRLYVVLDGVGGYAGGGEASLIVLKKLRENIEAMCEQHSAEANQGLEESVRKALKAATNSMLTMADGHPNLSKMSTVFALAYIVDGVLLYTHVGDCRVYLIRNGQAKQLTNDETFVQMLVDSGQIKPEQATNHPMKNIVLNAVGTRSVQYDPTVHSTMLLPGDVVVLTSDGVTDSLSNSEIVKLASEKDAPERIASSIVHAAIEGGSRDNASCIVVDIDRGPTADTDDQLHFELAKLHDLLSGVDSVNNELRNEMTQVAEDLRVALKKSESGDLGHLKDQLQERALQLEADHPHVMTAITSITNILSSMGI